MRPFQIFAAMKPEQALQFFERLGEHSPEMLRQAADAASVALKSRPSYVRKLAPEKRAATIRRALARVSSNLVAEELLAVYFLDCRKELLIEWLDAVGVEHEEGTLKQEAPEQPEDAKLRESVDKFLAAEDDSDRVLLLRAYAAQGAIEWPLLDELLEAQG